jgi:hypothetical protein
MCTILLQIYTKHLKFVCSKVIHNYLYNFQLFRNYANKAQNHKSNLFISQLIKYFSGFKVGQSSSFTKSANFLN